MKTLKNVFKKAVVLTLAVVMTVTMFGVQEAAAASKLKVTPTKKTIEAGKTVTLKSNKKVKWSIVKDKKVVKLSSKKSKSVKVKGLKAGKATVQAKAGKTVKKVTITVKKVVAAPTPAPVQPKPEDPKQAAKKVEPTLPTMPKDLKIDTDKKAIVVYYSHGENSISPEQYYEESLLQDTEEASANAVTGASIIRRDGKMIGNMTIMSEWIAEMLGADIYSIKTKKLYPNSKKDCQKEVRTVDHVSKETPEMEKCDIDFSKYDIIYLGFPNWYGEPPRVFYTFFKENEIDGKIVVPFTTVDNFQEKGGRYGDALNIIKSKLPNSPIISLGDEPADAFMFNRQEVLNPDAITLVKEKTEQSLKLAEDAKADPLATETAKMEAAKKLIGLDVTDEQIKEAVGQWTSKSVDVNGCTREVSSIRYFYPGFVIYARANDDSKTQVHIYSVD